MGNCVTQVYATCLESKGVCPNSLFCVFALISGVYLQPRESTAYQIKSNHIKSNQFKVPQLSCSIGYIKFDRNILLQ